MATQLIGYGNTRMFILCVTIPMVTQVLGWLSSIRYRKSAPQHAVTRRNNKKFPQRAADRPRQWPFWHDATINHESNDMTNAFKLLSSRLHFSCVVDCRCVAQIADFGRNGPHVTSRPWRRRF
jgi:hypothetical protein